MKGFIRFAHLFINFLLLQLGFHSAKDSKLSILKRRCQWKFGSCRQRLTLQQLSVNLIDSSVTGFNSLSVTQIRYRLSIQRCCCVHPNVYCFFRLKQTLWCLTTYVCLIHSTRFAWFLLIAAVFFLWFCWTRIWWLNAIAFSPASVCKSASPETHVLLENKLKEVESPGQGWSNFAHANPDLCSKIVHVLPKDPRGVRFSITDSKNVFENSTRFSKPVFEFRTGTIKSRLTHRAIWVWCSKSNHVTETCGRIHTPNPLADQSDRLSGWATR